MTLAHIFDGSPMTVHYGSQDSAVIATLSGSSTFSIPASVTEFFLKQVTPGVILTTSRITGADITSVTWNPEFKTKALNLHNCHKLTHVSPYLPSSVTNISYMFNNAWAFNQDISAWDTSSVENMTGMFYVADAFNQNLSNWDVSAVKYRTNFDTGATAWQAAFKPQFS